MIYKTKKGKLLAFYYLFILIKMNREAIDVIAIAPPTAPAMETWTVNQS